MEQKKKKSSSVVGSVALVVLLIIGATGAGWYGGKEGFLAQPQQGPTSEPTASPEQEKSAAATASDTASGSATATPIRRDVVFPDVQSVPRSQAEVVARAAVSSLATWDTRDDRGYGEAVARTAPLFDTDLAARVADTPGEPVSWDAQAVEKQAFSSPHVMDYDIYSNYTNEVRESSTVGRDGRELRFMQYAVRWDWLGRDGSGWRDENKIRVYELVMVKDVSGAWSVASYAWRDETS